jgi:hypothetical protein
MTFTQRLQAFDSSSRRLRRELTKAEDDLLELRDREKRMAAIRAEGDAELAEQYGMREG